MQSGNPPQSSRLSDTLRKSQLWTSVVTVTLVEGLELPVEVSGGHFFVTFRLGEQKFKSKVQCGKDFISASHMGSSKKYILFFFQESHQSSQSPVEGEVHV